MLKIYGNDDYDYTNLSIFLKKLMCLLRDDDDEQFRNNKMQIKTNKLKFFKTETTNTSTQIYLFIFNRPRPDPIRGLDVRPRGRSSGTRGHSTRAFKIPTVNPYKYSMHKT